MVKRYIMPSPARAQLLALAETIACVRKEKGWRQLDLAERAGVSRQTINRVEQGDPTIRAEIYFTVVWLLGITVIPGVANQNQKHHGQRVKLGKEKPVDDDF